MAIGGGMRADSEKEVIPERGPDTIIYKLRMFIKLTYRYMGMQISNDGKYQKTYAN